MEMPISKGCFLSVLLTLSIALTVPSVAADDCANVWCVANPNANRNAQQKDIDVLCNVMDCGPIKSGGACFAPNTILDHASFVFNTYFKDRACNPSTCNFGGDAIITKSNPSHGSCTFK
ncbi:glucan endo-1-3-beta-glucosidase [Musa troglodytarum]|uniref:Glucan endo-1-3-beta-glucosidase n=1 Tax=Musa troglodytarum TaxID=320322 RepID=A0A9E7JWK2_9LILI|nr:glucan endo-1-3-beta-glucosidase [Musa troglodytarum]